MREPNSGLALLSSYILRLFVVPQPCEPAVAQVTVWRPLRELEAPHERGPQPTAVFHLVRRESLAPPAAPGFREIHEGAFLCFQAIKALHQACPQRWRESVAGAPGIDQPAVLVIPEYQAVESPSAHGVAANHEFLSPIHPHFLPGARAPARLTLAVGALRHEPFQPLRLHRGKQVFNAGLELQGKTDRLRQPWQDVLLKQCAAPGAGLTHHVASGQDEHVEHVIDEFRSRRCVILEEIERRPPLSIERHHFSVQDRFIGQRLQRRGDGRITRVELVAVPRPQLQLAVALDGERPVAIQLDLIHPLRSLRQPLLPEQQHGLDETSFDLALWHYRCLPCAIRGESATFTTGASLKFPSRTKSVSPLTMSQNRPASETVSLGRLYLPPGSRS